MTPMPEFDDKAAVCTHCAARPGDPCTSYDPDEDETTELVHVHPNRWHRSKELLIERLTEYAGELEELLQRAQDRAFDAEEETAYSEAHTGG